MCVCIYGCIKGLVQPTLHLTNISQCPCFPPAFFFQSLESNLALGEQWVSDEAKSWGLLSTATDWHILCRLNSNGDRFSVVITSHSLICALRCTSTSCLPFCCWFSLPPVLPNPPLQSLKCMCSFCGTAQASSIAREIQQKALLSAGSSSVSGRAYELEIECGKVNSDSFVDFGLYDEAFVYTVMTWGAMNSSLVQLRISSDKELHESVVLFLFLAFQ